METSEVVLYGKVRLKGAKRKAVTTLQSHFEVDSSEVVLTWEVNSETTVAWEGHGDKAGTWL